MIRIGNRYQNKLFTTLRDTRPRNACGSIANDVWVSGDVMTPQVHLLGRLARNPYFSEKVAERWTNYHFNIRLRRSSFKNGADASREREISPKYVKTIGALHIFNKSNCMTCASSACVGFKLEKSSENLLRISNVRFAPCLLHFSINNSLDDTFIKFHFHTSNDPF